MSTVVAATFPNREQLIVSHLSQVRLLAARLHQRCPHQVELEDLISAGTLGLIHAVDRFQPERGYKLKTFADHRIRGAMLDYLRQLDPLPRNIRSFTRRLDAERLAFQAQFGRSPEPDELAARLGLPLEKFRRLECVARSAETVSLAVLNADAL